MTAATLRLPILAAAIVAYVLWVAIHVGDDPAYRTLFVEEFHTGEAGRAYHLFGSWVGEGGRWQSFPTSAVASLLSGLSYSLFGESLVALRIPFVVVSLASIGLFALACNREAPRQGGLAMAAALTFVLSPFLSALRLTSANETLLPLVAVLLILVLQAIETKEPRSGYRLFAAAGFLSAAAVVVKVDNVVLPAALAATFVIEWRSGRIKAADVAAFVVGGLACGALYLLTIWLTIGFDRLLDAFNFGVEVVAYRQSLVPRDALAPLVATIIALPKNFDVYLPMHTFVLVPTLAVAVLSFRRLSLAARFSLVFVAMTILASSFMPLIYWKKVTIAIAPLILLHLAVAKLLLSHPETISRRLLLSAVVVGAVLAVLVAASPFNGMWRVTAFWAEGSDWVGREVVLVGTAGVFVILLARFMDVRRILLGLYAMCVAAVAVSGLHLIVRLPARAEVAKIGREIAQAVGTADVVADHQGYRFVAPFSTARFRFVHENDPGFPSSIVAEAREREPEFVLVTNSYKPLVKMVGKDLPGYREVRRFDYVHPLPSFNERQATHRIVLFRKTQGGAAPSPEAK